MQSYAFFINDAICYRYQMHWCVCFSSKFEWIYRTFTSNKLEFLRGDRNCYILCSNFWSSEDRRGTCGMLVAWWGPVMDVQAEACCFVHLCFFIYIMRHNMRLRACWLPTCQSQVAEQWGLRLWLTWGPRFAVWTGMFQCRLGLATWGLVRQPQEASKGNAAVSRYSQLAIWIHLAV